MLVAQLSCLEWPRATVGKTSYVFDLAEDDDDMRDCYQEKSYTTWTVDRHCRKVDPLDDTVDSDILSSDEIMSLAQVENEQEPEDELQCNITKHILPIQRMYLALLQKLTTG